MTTRFSPPLLRFALWAVCLAFLADISFLSAADYAGQVLSADAIDDMEPGEPLPLPKSNSLLQRPKNKQVVFDDLDPDDSIIPQDFLDDDINIQAAHIIRQKQTQARTRKPKAIDTDVLSGNVFLTKNGAIIQEEIIYDYPCDMESCETCETEGYFSGLCGRLSSLSGPIPLTFGMGFFDNLTWFSDVTTFKTELNSGAGTLGFGEGINWSIPVTPQGTITAQYGVRAVQGEMFFPTSRNQLFMTAGLFKRLDILPVHYGAAIDWLQDRSQLGTAKMRQMRAEVSARTRRNLEFGFMGAFDVFRDRATPSALGEEVIAQDYYLLFARKHLESGGHAELRGGLTSRGDIMFSAFGEKALCDRLAVTGGVSLLAPTEGRSEEGYYRESWTMSLGVVLYFRGGAINRQVNLYRPLFDVAGNNSFLPRILQ